ncbi:hypothetical protein BC830DRAFT_608814 [Chytriomyces sp. MP71]|nr:hypothetical protein BC830DRAFT_608814 [Chytriomyces sp. MP71]
MCWSRKGKQLAVGDKGEGLVRQVSLEGVVKNTIAKPPCFAEIDVEVHSLVWLEDKVFVVIYHMTETEENVPFVITQSGTAKTGISTSYVRLEDPIFHEDDRTCNYLPVVLRDLGETKYLLAYASTSSNEIGFLGTRDDSSTAWARVSLADNVILPLDEADNDTHALGFDVDYTSRVTVPSKNPDMTPDLPPAPLLYVLTTEGSLLVYTLCDMRLAGRERSCPAMVAEVSSPTRVELFLLAARRRLPRKKGWGLPRRRWMVRRRSSTQHYPQNPRLPNARRPRTRSPLQRQSARRLQQKKLPKPNLSRPLNARVRSRRGSRPPNARLPSLSANRPPNVKLPSPSALLPRARRLRALHWCLRSNRGVCGILHLARSRQRESCPRGRGWMLRPGLLRWVRLHL